MADSPILSPQMQAQLEQLLGMSSQRLAEQQPVHAAAMAMAKHLAPGYAQDAMTSGGGAPSSGLGLTGTSGSSGGPGLGTTAAASFAAALLQNGGNNPLMLALKKLAGIGGGAADPTFGGLIQGNKPMAGGTGFPDVFGGGPNAGGMGPIPGYFQNPDGSMVGIGGDPANGGGYGGGLFPVNSNSPQRGNGGGDFGPYKD